MLCVVSVWVVRTKWLLVPALCFLGFLVVQMHRMPAYTPIDMLSPVLLATGLLCMYQASSWNTVTKFWMYWMGETLVITMFTLNSCPPHLKSTAVTALITIGALLLALWFRGKFWNYALVIGLEFVLALFIAISFPIMEMVLEAVVTEKLKTVGDKVRAHHAAMERYYQHKLQQKQQKGGGKGQ
jgi:hypothetical protein